MPVAFCPRQMMTAATSQQQQPSSLPSSSDTTIPSSLPVGATYRKSLSFPVLGKQAFEIQVLSDTTAHLVISGKLMTIDEVVTYTIDNKKKELVFNLSTETKQILQKFKTKLLEAGYDAQTDTPYVKIAPYVLPAVKIDMPRIVDADPSITTTT